MLHRLNGFDPDLRFNDYTNHVRPSMAQIVIPHAHFGR